MLSIGPAYAIALEHPNEMPLVDAIYTPAGWVIEKLSLTVPFSAYVQWWVDLAAKRAEKKHRVLDDG